MTLLEHPRTAPIPTPPDFPVAWENPDDERGFWTIDKLHWPDPQPIVLFDLLPEGSIGSAAAAYDLPLAFRARRINTYVYSELAPLPLPPDELEAMGRRAEEKIGAAIAQLGERWERDWLPEVQRQIAYWDAFDRRGATMPALLEHLDETVARLRQVWHVHFLVVLPFLVALSQFDELYRDLFGSEDALGAYKLLQGIDNKTVESGHEQWRLSRKALASPVVRRVLEEAAAADVVPMLEGSEEGRAFLAALHAYLAVYGARGDKFSTLVEPAWIEDSTPVIRNLKDFVAQPDRDLVAERAVLVAERERAVAAARAKLAGYPRPVVEEFEALFQAAQVATVLSEDHGYWIDYSATYRARRVLLEFGRRFAAAGVLEQANDVVHLTLDEIRLTAASLPVLDRRGLVAERKAEIERFRAIQAPPALGTPPEGPPPDDPVMRAVGKFMGAPLQPSTELGVLKGNAGSSGKVRGTARIIRSLAEAGRLGKGEILVAETTAPPWTPLFATAAAVVTDTGGVLSHCAVVAREYGIPAVVGVGTATTLIRDGQTIEVDGDAGVVRIVA
jgi:pyruvate,water dikinase